MTQPGNTPPTLHRDQTREALAHIKTMLLQGEKCENDLSSIRATLYVNFVNKETDGVQISKDDYSMITTHELMIRVLQSYSIKLKQANK